MWHSYRASECLAMSELSRSLSALVLDLTSSERLGITLLDTLSIIELCKRDEYLELRLENGWNCTDTCLVRSVRQ